VFVILTAAALAPGCTSESTGAAGLSAKRLPLSQFRQQDPDITGSVPGRAAAPSSREPAVASLRPPPTPVEIRAQCWMRYEQINASLDTKTALTQQCVSERLGQIPAN
jgi:hypothetical protein